MRCFKCDHSTSEGSSFLFSLDIKRLEESDGVGLTIKQRLELDNLLIERETIFDESTSATPYAIHRIRTDDHDPIAIPPYRLSNTWKISLKSEIRKMLDSGVIVEWQISMGNSSRYRSQEMW